MATSSQHILRWKHNRELIPKIPNDYSDWIVTVVFYTALHAVEAVLAKDGLDITSHRDRNKLLSTTGRYEYIRKHYMQLYSLSQTTRYMVQPESWIPYKEITDNVIKRYLYPIEKSAKKLLSADFELDAIVLS
jgi:hypothetical protein